MGKTVSKIDRSNLFYHLSALSRRWHQLLDSEFSRIAEFLERLDDGVNAIRQRNKR